MKTRVLIFVLLVWLPAWMEADAQLFRRKPQPRPAPARPKYEPEPDPAPAPTIPLPEPMAKPEAKIPNGWGVPVAAQLEIIRRGDLVDEIGTGHHGGLTLFAQAMGPPADDSWKWYISVIAARKDESSLQLLSDFKSDNNLRAFVSVDDFNQSWSHFNVFWADDQTQNWRWQKIKVTKYPVTLVQPPFNKKYGPSSTVVMQENGYDGNPTTFAAKIRKALEQYSHRLASTPAPTSGPQAEPTVIEGTPAAPVDLVTIPPIPTDNVQIGYDAPFKIPEPPNLTPERIIPRIIPNLPNIVSPFFAVVSFFSAVWYVVKFLFGSFLTNLLLLMILVALLMRGRRKSKATYDLVVDSNSAATIAAAVKSAIGSNRVNLQPGPPAWSTVETRAQRYGQGQGQAASPARKASTSQNPKLRLMLR